MKFLDLFRRNRTDQPFELVSRKVHHAMWESFSCAGVTVDDSRPVSVNIVMQDISQHMSAGPLSILYFGRFLLKSGCHVRLLIISDKSESELRDTLRYQNDDISEISGRFEVSPIKLQQDCVIRVNPRDLSVATLFSTAYAASAIQSRCRNKRFIYFIQDDEREFFPASSLRCAAEQSYAFDCYPLFSTKILAQHFLSEDIGLFRSRKIPVMWQGCPANYFLPPFEEFSRRAKKKFVFYARPKNPRNCYDFAMYLIIRALEDGVFDDSWEFYGIGYPEPCDLGLPGGRTLHMLPNMPLDEYRESLSTYDVALSLMATPHPSMPPVDLALSGCVVVTNTYKNKTSEVLEEISRNIISAPLLIEPLLDALRKGVELSGCLEERYENARNSSWPRSWDTALGSEHLEWIESIMGAGQ